MKRLLLGIMALVLLAIPAAAKSPDEEFRAFCQETFLKDGQCPETLCQIGCLGGKKADECLKVCSPKPCPEISSKVCPKEYCEVMTDCSKEKICQYQMYGEKASCGNLAYAGQDVECCEGLVRRCGVEFFDGSCDMEGKNSVYALAICIPCGDGVCGNFENRCNCPEDCKNPTLDKSVEETADKKVAPKADQKKKR